MIWTVQRGERWCIAVQRGFSLLFFLHLFCWHWHRFVLLRQQLCPWELLQGFRCVPGWLHGENPGRWAALPSPTCHCPYLLPQLHSLHCGKFSKGIVDGREGDREQAKLQKTNSWHAEIRSNNVLYDWVLSVWVNIWMYVISHVRPASCLA